MCEKFSKFGVGDWNIIRGREAFSLVMAAKWKKKKKKKKKKKAEVFN